MCVYYAMHIQNIRNKMRWTNFSFRKVFWYLLNLLLLFFWLVSLPIALLCLMVCSALFVQFEQFVRQFAVFLFVSWILFFCLFFGVCVFCKCFIFWFLILQPQHSTSTQCTAYYTTMPSHRSCSVLHFRSHMIWSVYGLIVPQLVFSGRRAPSKIFGCKHTK